MRINANELGGQRYIATLYGVDVPFCVEADDEAGYVIVDAAIIPPNIAVRVFLAAREDGTKALVVLPAVSLSPDVWTAWPLVDNKRWHGLKVEGVVTLREITE